MKRSILLFSIIFFSTKISGKEAIDENFKDTSTSNFIFCNARLLDWSLGAELKYMRLSTFNKASLSPLIAIGYEDYKKDNVIENGVYSVNGAFVKLGIEGYERGKIFTPYMGASFVFSYANQNVKSTFHDAVWGDYSESASVSDFKMGFEMNVGLITKIYRRWQTNLNVGLGSRFDNPGNPLTKTLKLDEVNSKGFPYFSPGMGQGLQGYFNIMAGLAYSF